MRGGIRFVALVAFFARAIAPATAATEAHNFGDQFRAMLERSDPEVLIAELRKRNADREAQNPFD